MLEKRDASKQIGWFGYGRKRIKEFECKMVMLGNPNSNFYTILDENENFIKSVTKVGW